MLLVLSYLTGAEAMAHGGGLNAQGCHNNRKTGDYHCHRAQQVSVPSTLQSGTDAPGSNAGSRRYPAQPGKHNVQTPAAASPVCYTGPRGGTYTLTSSGRKNYSGC